MAKMVNCLFGNTGARVQKAVLGPGQQQQHPGLVGETELDTWSLRWWNYHLLLELGKLLNSVEKL